MRFEILGPLQVHDGEQPVEVRGVRPRVLLGVLLARAGQVVPAGLLAELVWDGAPPEGAAATLRTHVMRLRRALGPRAGLRLVTRYPGYLVQADPGEVDILHFGVLCRECAAAASAGAWEQVWALAGEALGLWRGEPLADVASQALAGEEVPRLERLHLQVLEWYAEAGQHLGRHRELIPSLQELVDEHPLHERFHALLMLSLYRSGRQADALAAYQAATDVLAGELGANPGLELQALHQGILTTDPALAWPAGNPGPLALAHAGGPGEMAVLVPRQLPHDVPYFVAREAELRLLTGTLHSTCAAGGTAVVSSIGGMGGIGKTALAIHWAHQVAGRFRDGQLYVNLQGFGPSSAPVTPDEALHSFLESLGVAPEKIPASHAARAGLFQTMTTGKKILIVLDNARDEQQVRPLLPANSACLVLVTSRNPLFGLAVTDGARNLTLDTMNTGDAWALLTSRLGASRVAAEPDAVREVIAAAAGLPLALAIIAARAAVHAGTPLAALAAELRSQGGHAALDVGLSPASVRAVFSWSCNGLSPQAARMFRLLSVHPGTYITESAGAHLADLPPGASRDLLNELARAGLVSEPADGRFALHDLLRVFASEQAHALTSEWDRRCALGRLLNYYLAAATAAMDEAFPAEKHRRLTLAPLRQPFSPPVFNADGICWLDTERANLVAMAARSAEAGFARHAIGFAVTLNSYFVISANYSDGEAVCAGALDSARRIGDLASQAELLMNLARYHIEGNHDFRRTAELLGEAHILCHVLGDTHGGAQVLDVFGLAAWSQGQVTEAAVFFRRALAIYVRLGQRSGQSKAYNNLGLILKTQGYPRMAASHFRQALAISQETGDGRGEADALRNLGALLCSRGHFWHASDHIERSLVLSNTLGFPAGQCGALNDLGNVQYAQSRYQEALTYHRRALRKCEEAGYREGEVEALLGMGSSLSALNHRLYARKIFTGALGRAQQIGNQYLEARAHDGLANICHTQGDLTRAQYHWQQAFTRYTSASAPEAVEIQIKLSSLIPAFALARFGRTWRRSGPHTTLPGSYTEHVG